MNSLQIKNLTTGEVTKVNYFKNNQYPNFGEAVGEFIKSKIQTSLPPLTNYRAEDLGTKDYLDFSFGRTKEGYTQANHHHDLNDNKLKAPKISELKNALVLSFD